MAASLLLRGFPLLRLRLNHQHHRLATGVISPIIRTWCTAAEPKTPVEEDVSSSSDNNTASLNANERPNTAGWYNNDYRKWKDKEEEILRDIEAIVSLTKEILHSKRYMDGESLTVEDEEAVLQKLLSYHPSYEDKVGCGLDYIMVDRHPQFKHSRCLFVVRTDGGWIDFSYQKCLRAYIRDKYPAHAERFIQEHFKRGSG